MQKITTLQHWAQTWALRRTQGTSVVFPCSEWRFRYNFIYLYIAGCVVLSYWHFDRGTLFAFRTRKRKAFCISAIWATGVTSYQWLVGIYNDACAGNAIRDQSVTPHGQTHGGKGSVPRKSWQWRTKVKLETSSLSYSCWLFRSSNT